jgi:hypothetical protein
MRIDITEEPKPDPVARFDGVPQPGRDLEWRTPENAPHGLVYIDGARAFGVDLWVDGSLVVSVPHRSSASISVYDTFEGTYARDVETHAPWVEPDDFGADIRAIQAEISASPGHQARLWWSSFRRTIDVYFRNHTDLRALINGLNANPELALEMVQNVREPTAREEVLAQLDQRLMNLAASAAAIEDHAFALVKQYPSSSFKIEGDKQALAFKNLPVTKFMRDLRNYVVHREIPFVGYNVHGGSDGHTITTTFSIKTTHLEKWGKWNAPARSYMQSLGESIELEAFVEAHLAAVVSLSDWLFEQQRVLDGVGMFWLRELENEYNWTLTRGRKGRPRTQEFIPPST